MDKCCDNCNAGNRYICPWNYEFLEKEKAFWDTSKDYCSKWEEQETIEDIIFIEWQKSKNKEYEPSIKGGIDYATTYFKQRIEESLNKAESNYHEIDKIKVHFDWILN